MPVFVKIAGLLRLQPQSCDIHVPKCCVLGHGEVAPRLQRQHLQQESEWHGLVVKLVFEPGGRARKGERV